MATGTFDEREARIKDVIQEHYEDTLAEECFVHTQHVLDERVWMVFVTIVWAGDDQYSINTETLQATFNDKDELIFEVLAETDTDLRNEL